MRWKNFGQLSPKSSKGRRFCWPLRAGSGASHRTEVRRLSADKRTLVGSILQATGPGGQSHRTTDPCR